MFCCLYKEREENNVTYIPTMLFLIYDEIVGVLLLVYPLYSFVSPHSYLTSPLSHLTSPLFYLASPLFYLPYLHLFPTSPPLFLTSSLSYLISPSSPQDTLWASLTDAHCKTPMGVTAENLAAKYNITRQDADDFAFRSQTNWGKGGYWGSSMTLACDGRDLCCLGS